MALCLRLVKLATKSTVCPANHDYLAITSWGFGMTTANTPITTQLVSRSLREPNAEIMGCMPCSTRCWSRSANQPATEDLESSEHLWHLPISQLARCPIFSTRVLSPAAYLRPVRLTCWDLALLTAASAVI